MKPGVKGWLLIFFLTIVLQLLALLYLATAYTVQPVPALLVLSLVPLAAGILVWVRKPWVLYILYLYLVTVAVVSLISTTWQGIGYAILWGIYLLRSKRVKETYNAQ